jgi:hypothetical protein
MIRQRETSSTMIHKQKREAKKRTKSSQRREREEVKRGGQGRMKAWRRYLFTLLLKNESQRSGRGRDLN